MIKNLYENYDEIEEYLYNMSPEEKNIMKELNAQMKGYYEDFTGITRQTEEIPEMPEEVNKCNRVKWLMTEQ